MKTYTEQEIKAMCVPNIIKKMVELAKGFELELSDEPCIKFDNKYFWILEIKMCKTIFPLLIHRAIEGLLDSEISIGIHGNTNTYPFKNYHPENLTQLELALLHCLIEILEEEV